MNNLFAQKNSLGFSSFIPIANIAAFLPTSTGSGKHGNGDLGYMNARAFSLL